MSDGRKRRGRAVGVALAVALVALIGVAAVRSPSDGAANAGPQVAPEVMVRVELRSWIVAGRGRHLYAVVIPPENAPPEIAALADVVEYWSTAQRFGYQPTGDMEKDGRIAKMPRGVRVRPMLTEPDDRLEAVYEMTAPLAMELVRDRMFTSRYFLLGPNSTSGLRAAFQAAGMDLPQHVLDGRGILGEFPGVDLPAGPVIPAEEWTRFGVASGPEPFPPPPMLMPAPDDPGVTLQAVDAAAGAGSTPTRRRGRRGVRRRTAPPLCA